TLPGPAEGPMAPCDAVEFSPDGTRIASGGQDRVVRVWDAATGKQLWSKGGHARTISGVAFSADGRRLASASGGIVRDVPLGHLAKLKLPGDQQKDVPDLKVWDAATGQELLSLSLPGKTEALAISPDGEVVVAAFGNSRTYFRTAIVAGAGWRGAVQVTERYGGDISARLYSVATGKEVGRLKGHARPIKGVAFSPDGRRLVTAAGSDEGIKLWDAKTGEEVL